MKLTVVSIFRNSQHLLSRYFMQIDELQRALNSQGHELVLILGHGDNSDETETLLYAFCNHEFDAAIVDVSHGGEYYGSVVKPERFKNLAFCANRLWQLIPPDSDYVLWIESDLWWGGLNVASLLDGVEGARSSLNLGSGWIVLAPMVYTQEGCFYDTWAFKKDGVNFNYHSPYHKDVMGENRYFELDSGGSVLLIPGELARMVTWPQEDAIVGLCRNMRALGARVFLDTKTKVVHP